MCPGLYVPLSSHPFKFDPTSDIDVGQIGPGQIVVRVTGTDPRTYEYPPKI
jgi:hypothetical protein